MEASAIAAIGVISAFTACWAAIQVAIDALRRKGRSLAAQGRRLSPATLLELRLRSGFPALFSLSNLLMRNSIARRYCEGVMAVCEDRGWKTSLQAVMSVVVVAVASVFVLASFITGGIVGGIAASVCLIAVSYLVVGNFQDNYRQQMREEIPGALELMSACFGAGFTLMQTFEQIAQETEGRLSVVFARSAHVLETGGSAESAFAVLQRDVDLPELAFVVAALDVQHRSGGAIAPVLRTALESVKSELGLKRSLSVQTAQAKLSARVVIAMPFILIAAFSFLTPDFLAPFFASPAGYALLGVALAMQAAGIMLVRRALNVDGVS